MANGPKQSARLQPDPAGAVPGTIDDPNPERDHRAIHPDDRTTVPGQSAIGPKGPTGPGGPIGPPGPSGPIPSVSRTVSSIKVKSGRTYTLARIKCPQEQKKCVVSGVQVNWRAKQEAKAVRSTPILSRSTIPRGGVATVRAKVPQKVASQLSRKRTGSVTVELKAAAAGALNKSIVRIAISR